MSTWKRLENVTNRRKADSWLLNDCSVCIFTFHYAQQTSAVNPTSTKSAVKVQSTNKQATTQRYIAANNELKHQ